MIPTTNLQCVVECIAREYIILINSAQVQNIIRNLYVLLRFCIW